MQANSPYIDTHCHLDTINKWDSCTLSQTLHHISQSSCRAVVHNACSVDGLHFITELIQTKEPVFPLRFFTAGIHPHDAKDMSPQIMEQIQGLAAHPQNVAIGEIGLDYHYEESERTVQKRVFRSQLQLARQLKKPIVIHTRSAEEDTLQILSEEVGAEQRLHIHCFTGTAQYAQQLLALPATVYFGFTGIVTFKNAQSIRDAFLIIPPERIVLETDAPYLAPVPFRGKTAYPNMIPEIAQQLAHIQGTHVPTFYSQCLQNSQALYGLSNGDLQL